MGTVPGRDLARALAAWPAPAPRSGWHGLPGSVTATTGTSPDGRRVHVVHNWGWEPVDVEAPEDLAVVLDGSSMPAGGPVRLGAWYVRVFATH